MSSFEALEPAAYTSNAVQEDTEEFEKSDISFIKEFAIVSECA